MKPAQPVRAFRITPLSRGSLFLDVKVFATKKSMYSWFRWFTRHEKRIGCNFEAIVLQRHVIDCRGPKPRSIPRVATMLFVKTRMTMSIVTHESGHAALAWFRRKFPDLPDVNSDLRLEEKLCYVLGDIGRQIVLNTKDLWRT